MTRNIVKHALLALSFCLAIATLPAQGQSLPTFTPVYAPAVSGNTYTFGPKTVNSANAPSFTFGPAANGSVYGSTPHQLGLGGGKTATVSVRTSIPNSQVAKAVAVALGKGIVRAAAVYQIGETGYEIYQLLKGRGITAQDDGTFAKTITGKVCAAGVTLLEFTTGEGSGCNPSEVCQSVGGTYYPQGAYAESCERDNPYKKWQLSFRAKTDQTTTSTTPLTIPQIEAEVTPSLDGYPRIDPLVKEAASQSPIDAPAPSQVTGPSQVADPSPSTQTNPDGSKSVTNTSTKLDYGPNTVKVTDQTTVTTLDPSGSPTGTTTTETPANITPTPEPQPDPCEAHPERIGCAAFGTPTGETVSKTSQAVAVTAIAFASSATCPAPLSFALNGAQYAVSYQPMCDRLGVLRALFLVMAGVLAAYIFADSFRV